MFNKKDPWDFSLEKGETGKEYQELVHRVFRQNADGAKLLELWTVQIMSAYAPSNNPQFADGYEAFVKQIHVCIKRTEEQ